ncbi:hypothetical protein CK203_100443 [Vitis vinifera]|uniref:Reverse transcriptase RNase H-like domain-containing protein n=1 Tax=Vitis vinifera TaxID=29760 RepID=A0A438CJ24_VITVI|nr:hypothetical protein CK203_100443 [Vitis vinifera]
MQDELNESLEDLEEGLSAPADVLATLQENNQCPVVISSSLIGHQEISLLEVLKSPWVSPTQVVPKKSGITVVQNEKGEEIATCLTSSWRVCIDYKEMNAMTRKDHFPLPFIDQEKTTFTCPFGTYAYEECRLVYAMHLQHSKDDLYLAKEDGKPYVIYYASKTLNEAQRNYTTIEKELLVVVFALDKFRAYWQADHLSRLAIAHNSHVLPINDDFPEESLMLLEKAPWYAHIANYFVTGEVPSEWKAHDMKHFFTKIHAYYWEEPFLFKYCADQSIRKCVHEEEQQGILVIAMRMPVEATSPLKK